jgi:hypothetical protein
MSGRDPALEPFDALIGTWETEAKHRAVDEIVRGGTTFDSRTACGASGATSPVSTSASPPRSAPTSSRACSSSPETQGDWQEDMRVTYRRR